MKCDLSWDLLVRAADRELSPEEEQRVMGHVAECGDCRRELEDVRSFSLEIELAVNTLAVADNTGGREQLAALMAQQDLVKPIRQPLGRVMRRFGWGMAIAATLALAILVAPKQTAVTEESRAARQSSAFSSTALEVDGESFVALPYSNPDLPVSAPRIVQMQVPVSSLADIGIALEPLANQVSNQDRSVLADVLLGADGQPLGVHVVSWD